MGFCVLLKIFARTSEATGDLIGNKSADRITKVSKPLPQKNSEIFKNKEKNIGLDIEIRTERQISTEKWQQFFNDLRPM